MDFDIYLLYQTSLASVIHLGNEENITAIQIFVQSIPMASV